MGLKRRIRRLEEQTGHHFEVAPLGNGEFVRYTAEDALDALGASIDGHDHWLLPAARQAPSAGGLLSLVGALERSKERLDRGEDAL